MSRRRPSCVIRGSAAVACSTWLRVNTSSPTRFIIWFNRCTSTRRVLSAALDVPAAASAVSVSLFEPCFSVARSCVTTSGTGAHVACSHAASTSIATAAFAGSPVASAVFCAAFALTRLVPPAAFGFSACSVASVPISSASCPEPASPPSSPSASIDRKIPRSRSRSASRPVIISALAFSFPSRSNPSRFSPACASFSSRPNPRKPVVPLMVCTARKISPSSPASSGLPSSSVRQCSIRSSPSWLSIRNSRIRSSIGTHPAGPPSLSLTRKAPALVIGETGLSLRPIGCD